MTAIQDGLASDKITQKLYQGAIFLVQVSYYSSIYDDQVGCALIDYDGRYRGASRDQMVYADADSYLASTVTSDGNPA